MTEERYFGILSTIIYEGGEVPANEEAEFTTSLVYRITNGYDLTPEEIEYIYKTYTWVDTKDTVNDGKVLRELIYKFNGKFYLTSMYCDYWDGFEYESAVPFVEVELKKVIVETEKWVEKEIK